MVTHVKGISVVGVGFSSRRASPGWFLARLWQGLCMVICQFAAIAS